MMKMNTTEKTSTARIKWPNIKMRNLLKILAASPKDLRIWTRRPSWTRKPSTMNLMEKSQMNFNMIRAAGQYILHLQTSQRSTLLKYEVEDSKEQDDKCDEHNEKTESPFQLIKVPLTLRKTMKEKKINMMKNTRRENLRQRIERPNWKSLGESRHPLLWTNHQMPN